jgi:PKD repeat protein
VQVALGGYTLAVGDSAGSIIAPSSTSTQREAAGSGVGQAPVQGDSRALRRALARSGRHERRKPSEKLEVAVENASEVTDKVERAFDLVKEFASGNLGVETLGDEADALLGLLQRLSLSKRWEDTLRVARCLAVLLALIGRWIELLRSLRVALDAAKELGDPLGEAWALHELGTLNLAAGSHAEADRRLGEARQIRERHANSRELRVTNGNLQVLCQTLRRLAPQRPIERMLEKLARRPALALLVAVTLLVVGGAGGAVLADSGGREPPFHPAVVAFSFVPDTPHAGQSIAFSATAADAPDPASSYTWQWGDGDPASGRAQRHIYRKAGTYTVVLIARDTRGRTIGRIARPVVIERPTVEHGPNAYFSFQPRSPAVGRPVLFDASSSYDPSAPITAYEWSFGDGDGARGVTASHSFAQPGTYTVALTVTDTDGQRNTLAQTVTVSTGAGRQTAVVLRCPASHLAVGEVVIASGAITPARAGATVVVVYVSPSGRETTRTLTSEARGSYTTSFTPEEEGSWSARATQAEGGGYLASTSEPCTFSVAKGESTKPLKETTTTIECPSHSLLGAPVTVSGTITPVRAGVAVEVIYVSPSGKPIGQPATIGPEGAYTASFTPEEAGPWSVHSAQAESSGSHGSASRPCAFSVEKPQYVPVETQESQ